LASIQLTHHSKKQDGNSEEVVNRPVPSQFAQHELRKEYSLNIIEPIDGILVSEFGIRPKGGVPNSPGRDAVMIKDADDVPHRCEASPKEAQDC
jgi:hypothetical protein